MKKNFIQKHTQLIALILICFLIIPFIQNSYALNKTDVVLNIESADKDLSPVEDVRSVVLDAGHGGYDDGSVSAQGLKEKDLVLSIVKKIGENLESEQIRVIYTRDSDQVSWIEDNVQDLFARSQIANEAKADVFVSIHMNDTEFGNDVSGNEVWVQFNNDKSMILANAINQSFMKLDYTENRGLKDEATSPLSLLQFNTIPSVLVETGFISSVNDVSYLTTEEGERAVAKAISDGIIEALDIIK